MVQFGIHNEGTPTYPLKQLDNGYVVPDVSLSEVHEHNRELVRNQIEIGVRAEELGYDFILHPENHLGLVGSNSPTPRQVQVAVAERTEDIRLVQMANILPWHEPVKMAERIGMLDTISDGRAEVGVGTGSGNREMEVFHQYRRDSSIDSEENWEIFLEKLEILTRAWTQDSFSFHGKHYDIPPEDVRLGHVWERHYLADDVSGTSPDEVLNVEGEHTTLDSISVFPQPEQEPHPQLWKPVGSKRSAAWAAQHGINGCTYCTDFSWVSGLIETYYEFAEKTDWADRRPEYDGEPFRYGWDERRGRGLVSEVQLFNTDVASDEAIERYKRGLELLAIDSFHYDEEGSEVDVDEYLERNDAPILGDSEEIIDKLATFRDVCDYEDFFMFVSIDVPGMTHEDKVEQMEAFSEEVAPYFEDEANA